MPVFLEQFERDLIAQEAAEKAAIEAEANKPVKKVKEAEEPVNAEEPTKEKPKKAK